jgi:hypothetical protein
LLNLLPLARRYSEAIADCTLALFYDDRNIKALYRRGMALALTGNWKAAFAGSSLFRLLSRSFD